MEQQCFNISFTSYIFSQYLRRILSILVHDDIDQMFFKPINDELERRINSFFLLETAIAKVM